MKSKNKIRKELIEHSYEIGKLFFNNEIEETEAIHSLMKYGIMEYEAAKYLNLFSNLIQGKKITYTIEEDFINYYFKNIKINSLLQ